jgi:hypothetical protein
MEGLIVASIFIGMVLITSIILVIVGIKEKDWSYVIMGSIFTIICIVCVVATMLASPEPTALDVYRGLTELEITSVNGVPKDTVVVYKNK